MRNPVYNTLLLSEVGAALRGDSEDHYMKVGKEAHNHTRTQVVNYSTWFYNLGPPHMGYCPTKIKLFYCFQYGGHLVCTATGSGEEQDAIER